MKRITMDRIGHRSGRALVVAIAENDQQGRPRVVIDCDCGTTGTVVSWASVRDGDRSSCGCRHAEIMATGRRTHGATAGRQTPEYRTWSHIKERCNSPSASGYRYYGGRGISMDNAWSANFATFLRDVGPRPSPEHTIDRIDVNGNYEPGNVRWATQKEQQRNRGNNHIVAIGGKSMSLAAWAEEAGIPYETFRQRLAHGWTPELAYSTPLTTGKSK